MFLTIPLDLSSKSTIITIKNKKKQTSNIVQGVVVVVIMLVFFSALLMIISIDFLNRNPQTTGHKKYDE
jgi:hypothetical protein